jgi:hypothetical protein
MTDLELCESFNKLHWHDSKLRSFGVVRKDDRDDIVFQFELNGEPEGRIIPATLTLVDATYLRAEVDLDGKYQCADDISSARCDVESTFKAELLSSQLKHSPTALDGYYYFDIYLIPPGGRIQVFAKTFEVKHATPQ